MFLSLINKFNKSFYILSMLLLCNFIIADPTDGCDLNSNQLFLTEQGDVLYNSESDIAGFQFDVTGTTVSGVSGGAAAEAGFTVSAGGSTVLGFSFTGSVIPAGCGTLVELELNGESTGLSGIIISLPLPTDRTSRWLRIYNHL